MFTSLLTVFYFRTWFEDLLKDRLVEDFETDYDSVCTGDMLLYGDFMVPNADPKVTAQKKLSFKYCHTRETHFNFWQTFIIP